MIPKTQDEITKKWPEAWGIPMVSIRCTAYNHEAYISQALDGFLAQETTFPFEIIIHEDASTDGTASIVKEYETKYPLIIKPIYQTENQYSKHDGSITRIMNEACKGKYIAFCEGDDFWIDPQKLQKQVDFLENNPEYGMCYTDFNVYSQKNNHTKYSCFSNQPVKYPTDYDIQKWIVKAGYVAPMTWVVRRYLWENASANAIKSPDGTYVLFAYFLANSKVQCLKDATTATYRILPESAVHSKTLEKTYNRFKSMHEVQLTLARLYIDRNILTSSVTKIKKLYYHIGLKIFVAMKDKNEINESKKWIESSPTTKMLYLISRFKLLTSLYSILYKTYYKLK